MVEEQENTALSNLSDENAKDNIKLKEEIYQLKQEIQKLHEVKERLPIKEEKIKLL